MIELLVARFSSDGSLVAQCKSDWVNACLRAFSNHEDAKKMMADQPIFAADDFWPDPQSWKASYRPYNVKDGVLQIPVQGTLVNNFGYTLSGWLTGYQYIQKAMERGMDDSQVRGIALMINSPGGEVSGNFDLVDRMYAMRGKKPIKAMVNDAAYSAAFNIATTADKITMTRSAGTGSVGVVTAHIDRSKAMDEMGVKLTFIYAGEHKVDGNPYEPLPAAVKDRIQAKIDDLYSVFTSTVARNLGMTQQAVKDTEALTYGSDESLKVGFAHEVAAPEEALSAFSAEVNKKGVTYMSGQATDTKPETAPAEQLSAARAEGVKEGAANERTRIKAITGLDEAKNRTGMANHIAMQTSMNVEEAKSLLAASPEEKPMAVVPVAASPFEQAMAKDNPNVGAGGGGGETKDAQTMAAGILNAYQKAGGETKKKGA